MDVNDLVVVMCRALKSPRASKSPPGGPRNILARARPEPEFCNSKPALGPRAYSEGPPEARRAFINVNSMKNYVIFLLRKTIFLKSGHFRN